MFESIAQSSRGSLGRRAVMTLVSVALHTAALLAFVIAPLLFLEAFPAAVVLTFLLAPPLPPAPVPMPLHRVTSRQSTRKGLDVRREFEAPAAIPASIPAPDDASEFMGTISAVTGPGVAALGPGVPGSIFGSAAPPVEKPLTPPAPPKPKQTPPQRISSGVQESKLVHKVEPAYPELARRARISGVVILEVTVDEEGVVADVRVLRGHPLLDEEAVRAVRQWRYSPTLLSGEPVPVIATVTVVFKLR